MDLKRDVRVLPVPDADDPDGTGWVLQDITQRLHGR